MPEETNNKARIALARNLARRLIKDAKITQAPISLSAIIQHLQESHDLGVYSSSSFSDNLAGFLVTVENEFLDERRDEIHYNENHGWHKRRFTIAHEIGHLILNTGCDNLAFDLYSSRSPTETEANQFAAELLMPLAMLKRDLKAMPDIPKLAWRYIVSVEAMGWKLSGSSLLTK